MSIPTPFNPLGTLGGFKRLLYVVATRDVYSHELPTPFWDPDFTHVTFHIRAGYERGISAYSPIFAYIYNRALYGGFEAFNADLKLWINNGMSGDQTKFAWDVAYPYFKIFDVVITPTKITLDGVDRELMSVRTGTAPNLVIINKHALIESVELYENGQLKGNLVAVERTSDGAKGLYCTVAKQFIEF